LDEKSLNYWLFRGFSLSGEGWGSTKKCGVGCPQGKLTIANKEDI
jgi:hypothetical protein